MIRLVVLAVSLGSAAGSDSDVASPGDIFCDIVGGLLGLGVEVCSIIEHRLNITAPDCQASAKKVLKTFSAICPQASEGLLVPETSPADVEKMFCKIAHNQATEDMLMTKVCSTMQHFNISVPDCQAKAKKLWDKAASMCPKAALGAPLTEAYWKNCQNSMGEMTFSNITLTECKIGSNPGLETTCTGKYAGVSVDDFTYDMSMKEQDSGPGPFPEPYTLNGHCKGDASNLKPCVLEYPLLGPQARLTMRPFKLPVTSGEFSVTYSLQMAQSIEKKAHTFFFQGTSKLGEKLFCLEIDVYMADSATSPKLAPLVVV